MCTHADVSEAMESAHTLAGRVVSVLASGVAANDALLLALALKDDIDALRALHLRAVVQGLPRQVP